ncbi:MAG: GGDEF domain-containing protein [Polyangiales bacterium]
MGQSRRDEDITQEVALPPEVRPRQTALTLHIVKGPRTGAVLTIDGPSVVLGRGDDADLRIPDPSLSRMHARFERSGDDTVVTDLDSLNGTLVEGTRLSGPLTLQSGQLLTLGNVQVRFAVQDAAEVQVSRDLYEAAVRDRLTGLYNRGYFDERLAAEFAFVTRHQTSLALLLIDLDHFKQVNDNHGHPTGDLVLQAAAAKIRGSLRAEDLAARYGGEEFVVLARSTDTGGATVLGQRLRTRIAQSEVRGPNGLVKVTASVGIAVMRKEIVFNGVGDFLQAADEALYEAKRGGRNRVVLHPTATHAPGRVDGSYTLKGAQHHDEVVRPRSKRE